MFSVLPTSLSSKNKGLPTHLCLFVTVKKTDGVFSTRIDIVPASTRADSLTSPTFPSPQLTSGNLTVTLSAAMADGEIDGAEHVIRNLFDGAKAPHPDLTPYKTARATSKRALTRYVNSVMQQIAEKDISDFDHVSSKLKHLFKQFQSSCDEYQNLVESESELDACDTYFAEKQSEYIHLLKLLQELSVSSDLNNSALPFNSVPSPDNDSFSKEDLIQNINLPKVELQSFDGNPVHYHTFIQSFKANVDKICSNPETKLTRLLQYLSDNVKQSISGCQLIGGQAGYDRALHILESRYGNCHLVTETILSNLKTGKNVRSPEEIRKFSDELENAALVLKKLKTYNEVNTNSVMLEIVARLPTFMQNKWRSKSLKIKRDSGAYPKFSKLVEFISKNADDMNDPVYGNYNGKSDGRKVSNAATSSDNHSGYGGQESPCILCKNLHRLWYCDKFKSMKPHDRRKLVTDNKLCENCLRANHSMENCRKNSVCKVPKCGLKHTQWIHVDAMDHSSASNANHNSCDPDTFMPIVRVNVNESVSALCLLDSGSNSSFCTRALVDSLGISGQPSSFQLQTINKSESKTFESVDITITSADGERIFMPNTYVVDRIPVKSAGLDKTKFPYLQDIPLNVYDTSLSEVEILIGQNHAEAFSPLDSVKGDKKSAYAVKTILGWTLFGYSRTDRVNRRIINTFVTQLENHFNPVTPAYVDESDCFDQLAHSHDDLKVIKLWDDTAKKVDGRYQLPIPFKKEIQLPNNYPIAKTRLDHIVKN